MTAELRSPLGGRAVDLELIDAVEVVGLAQVDVQCTPEDASRLGFPREPNTVTIAGAREILWLGPDEWLVVDGSIEPSVLVTELAALGRSVVDVSANRAVIDLTGEHRLELLASGCGIDLHRRGGWLPGRCAQTLFARAPVLLQDRADATRVFVRPSFSGYLLQRLLVA